MLGKVGYITVAMVTILLGILCLIIRDDGPLFDDRSATLVAQIDAADMSDCISLVGADTSVLTKSRTMVVVSVPFGNASSPPLFQNTSKSATTVRWFLTGEERIPLSLTTQVKAGTSYISAEPIDLGHGKMRLRVSL
jgi:hypothetical protein